jgi:hypothetical protein
MDTMMIEIGYSLPSEEHPPTSSYAEEILTRSAAVR